MLHFKQLDAGANTSEVGLGEKSEPQGMRSAGTILLVTYCSGPHRGGAARGALRLTKLGRPVKVMAGGITGWIDEGFELAASGSPA